MSGVLHDGQMRLEPPVIIPAQFNGPSRSGNGGYVCGLVGNRLADRLGADQPVTATLRVPPPLETVLAWRDEPGVVRLVAGVGAVVAEATAGTYAGTPVEPVPPDVAAQAYRDYEGYVDHPFPHCFVCGSARTLGDGLLVWSGPVGDGRMACPWSPPAAFCADDGLLRRELVWAVLDCPGGWAAGIKANPMVLGRMTASVARRPKVAEPCLVVADRRGTSGRKNHAATTLYGADGDIIGRSEQTWITIDIEAFS